MLFGLQKANRSAWRNEVVTSEPGLGTAGEEGQDAGSDRRALRLESKLGKLAPEATKAFWAYDKGALADGAIPKKYKEMMAVGAALTTQCAYCIEIHRSRLSKPVPARRNWRRRFTSRRHFALAPPSHMARIFWNSDS